MNDQVHDVRKGRGAYIAHLLRQKLDRPGQVIEPVEVEDESPKPRGRAHMIESLRKMHMQKLGLNGHESNTNTVIEDTSIAKVSSSTIFAAKETMPSTSAVKERKDFIGTSGKPVPATANYIRIEIDEGFGLFQYEVNFKPDVDSELARFKLVNSVILEYSKSKTFDGQTLFLPQKIFENSISFDLKHPYDDSDVSMTVIFRKQVQYDEYSTLFNLLFQRVMRVLDYRRVKKQFFDDKHPIPVPQHKLEIWPGFVTVVSECAGGLMLCLDVSHRLLRTQTVFDYMTDTILSHRERGKDIITKNLVGSVVLTHYNNRSYVVHDIAWDMNPTSAFITAKGEVTYLDYYKKQYNIDIRDKFQPLLVNRKITHRQDVDRKEQIIVLIPELCNMTGLSDAMRADRFVMKDIAQYTRIRPEVRMNSLRKFLTSVKECPEAESILSGWGLHLRQATIDLQMRVLSPEIILFGDDVMVQGTEKADWTGAVMKNKVLSAIDIRRWLVLYTAQDEKLVHNFIDNIMRLGPKMGIMIVKPMLFRMPDDRTETYMRILTEKINPDLQIVVVICPTNRDDRYSAIKKVCCFKKPIASQVINGRTLKNPTKLAAIVQKIALQMNCKLGGTLWSVKFPFKKWMICGMDVYHVANQATGRAVCGFVSSLNESMTRWYSTCAFHSSDKEIAEHVKAMFLKALNEYRFINCEYPSHVIIYRDGVGDGQLETCQEFETNQLRDLATEMKLDIKIIFIIVQKRINSRLFIKHHGITNPSAGSIVDTQITRPYLNDFFLVPQNVCQGTVTPIHYIVLENEANLKADYIQRLTYKLCHLYYNWTGTVRVPAPCQYAHKLAFLVGQHIRNKPAEPLNTKLFYL